MLQIQLLGDFHLLYAGKPLESVDSARLQSLLAYLLLHWESPQARHYLAFLFWPDSTEEQAHANLRYVLFKLRQSLPDSEQFLRVQTKTLQWRNDSPFVTDVLAYRQALVQASHQAGDPTAEQASLREAVALYQGDLLPSCYDEWILPERERLRQSFLQILERLIALSDETHDYASAIHFAQRLLEHDPLHEAAYQHLIRLYALNGARAHALRVYHTCVTTLEREVGVEPMQETKELYAQLMGSEVQIGTSSLSKKSATFLPLVGREMEWQRLQEIARGVLPGMPHFLLISGEAGIGKTRLAEELVLWAGHQGISTVRTRAYAAEGQLTYVPVVEWLRSDLYRDKVRMLDSIWLVELARLLPELLSEITDLSRSLPLTDNWQRQRLFEALAHAALCVGLPLIVLIDDLQWADQETLEWLHFLLRFNPSAALLVVGTARMEEVDSAHPLSVLRTHLQHAGKLTEITLTSLSATASAELAQQVAGRPLNAEILAALNTYAEGVPLFLVEAIRAGAGKNEEESWRRYSVRAADSTLLHTFVPLPPRVYAVLQARLAQLSPEARQLADLAAVIGRSFTFDLLAQASDVSETELVRALDELWKRRIVHERGSDYDISHDRIRDVTYAELSPMQRRLLHRRVAHALERLYASDLDIVSAQLTWHYEQAGLPSQAVDYYRRAGMAAQRVYANNQAIDLFFKGLALLEELPASPQRDTQELALQMAIAGAVRTRNFLAPEVIQALNRALELSRKVDDVKGHFWPLWGLVQYHTMKAEMQQCQELGNSVLTIAEQEQSPLFLLVAHSMAGSTNFLVGDFIAAKRHFAHASSLYTVQLHEELFLYMGFDYGLLSLVFGGHALWCLGHADNGLRDCQKAIDMAQQLAHPFSQVLVLAYVAMFHQFRGEREAAQTQAEAALVLATRHEVGYYGTWAALLMQWTLTSAHPTQAEIAALRSALDDLRATGTVVRWPYYLSLLAEVYGKAGQPAAGLATIDEALSTAAAHGEHWWDAELHRMRGRLLLTQGADLQQAEASFQQALAIARQQQALALELRAATSLARMWQQQRQTDQAFRLLTAVYGKLEEGFDTPDLKEARALIQELSGVLTDN